MPRPNFESSPLVAAVARRMTVLPRERGSYLDMAAYHARAAADWMEREREGYSWASAAVGAELDLCQACYALHQKEISSAPIDREHLTPEVRAGYEREVREAAIAKARAAAAAGE